jgi:hypothetical protein
MFRLQISIDPNRTVPLASRRAEVGKEITRAVLQDSVGRSPVGTNVPERHDDPGPAFGQPVFVM